MVMIQVLSFSEAGGHPFNEDAFGVERHPADADCWLAVLADGQGGTAGGAQAAQLACRTALEAAKRTPTRKLTSALAWTTLLCAADQAVYNDPQAGFTTLIGFCLAGPTLVGASCGDSAVLAISHGE